MDYLKGHNFKIRIDNEYFDAEKTFTINRQAETGMRIRKTGNENYVKRLSWSLDVEVYMTADNHSRLLKNKNVVDVTLTDEGVQPFVLPFTSPFYLVEKKEYNDVKITGKAIIASMEETFPASDFAAITISFTGVSETLEMLQSGFDGDTQGFILSTTFPVIFVEDNAETVDGFPYTFPFKLN